MIRIIIAALALASSAHAQTSFCSGASCPRNLGSDTAKPSKPVAKSKRHGLLRKK